MSWTAGAGSVGCDPDERRGTVTRVIGATRMHRWQARGRYNGRAPGVGPVPPGPAPPLTGGAVVRLRLHLSGVDHRLLLASQNDYASSVPDGTRRPSLDSRRYRVP